MPGYARVAVVTGANKGVGHAIVRSIALQYNSSPLNSGPLLIYLTARDSQRGQTALKTILDDEELSQKQSLVSNGGLTEIVFHQLDISSSSSISDFADFLKTQHPTGIDAVINNAGIAMDGFNNKVVEETLGCNYFGTLGLSKALLPQLKQDPAQTSRVVNVSSTSGNLGKFSPALQARFRGSETVEDVTVLMNDFTSAVQEGKEKDHGWPSAAYATSKAGVTLMTRALAREEKARGSHTLVNSCCVGLVNTDMTKGRGTRTPTQGARTPVMLALADLNGRSGGFWLMEKEQKI